MPPHIIVVTKVFHSVFHSISEAACKIISCTLARSKPLQIHMNFEYGLGCYRRNMIMGCCAHPIWSCFPNSCKYSGSYQSAYILEMTWFRSSCEPKFSTGSFKPIQGPQDFKPHTCKASQSTSGPIETEFITGSFVEPRRIRERMSVMIMVTPSCMMVTHQCKARRPTN